MRDDPYPARFYGRQIDEPLLTNSLAALIPHQNSDSPLFSLQKPLERVFLVFMTLYLVCALFFIFAVSSYAAPLGSATIPSAMAAGCIELATIATR